MKFTEEDLRELVFVFAVTFILFIFWIATPLNALIHEVGHQYTCLQQGGNYLSGDEAEAYFTRCQDIEWNSFQVLLFMMGGILAEFFLGLGLLLIPLISPLGAFILLQIPFNMFMGRYETDLTKASEILPAISFLQNPVVQIVLIIIGAIVVVLGLYYTKRMVKKLDIPLID